MANATISNYELGFAIKQVRLTINVLWLLPKT